MTGRGKSHGAITVINATATGVGCSLATEGGVEATWTWRSEPGVQLDAQPSVDDHLARAVLEHVRQRRPEAPAGAIVTTQSGVAASRGLKTSSGAAAAMVHAALEALDGTVPEAAVVVDAAIEASLAAGVTLTGAYDDQVAVTLGGCHLTDNKQRRVLAELDTPPWEVAVWVPGQQIAKSQVGSIDTTTIRSDVEEAIAAARAGDVPRGLTLNGAAYHRLYSAAGLPVTDAPTQVALENGALGAGLSGTGPAVAALFEPGDRRELPPCEGGEWMWTRAVRGAP